MFVVRPTNPLDRHLFLTDPFSRHGIQCLKSRVYCSSGLLMNPCVDLFGNRQRASVALPHPVRYPPADLEKAAAQVNLKLNLRYQEGYDHSYFFISSFIKQHLMFHAAHL